MNLGNDCILGQVYGYYTECYYFDELYDRLGPFSCNGNKTAWIGEINTRLKGNDMLQELQDAYAFMQKNCGIEVGDTVKVLRKAKNYENGWGTCWNDDMSNLVGKTFEVASYDTAGFLDRKIACHFPFFVLELVEKALPKIMIGEHEVEFDDLNQKLVIGCTRIRYSQARKIFDRIPK